MLKYHWYHARCSASDALERTRQGEYVLVRDCTLLDMADEVTLVRRQLERMGITVQAGAAELLKGETKDQVVGRAREAAGATLSRAR